MTMSPETTVIDGQRMNLSEVEYQQGGWDFVFHLFSNNFSDQEVIEAPVFVARRLLKVFPFERKYQAAKLRKVSLKSSTELADQIEALELKDLLKLEREMLEAEMKILKNYSPDDPIATFSASLVDKLFRNFEVTLIAKHLQ